MMSEIEMSRRGVLADTRPTADSAFKIPLATQALAATIAEGWSA